MHSPGFVILNFPLVVVAEVNPSPQFFSHASSSWRSVSFCEESIIFKFLPSFLPSFTLHCWCLAFYFTSLYLIGRLWDRGGGRGGGWFLKSAEKLKDGPLGLLVECYEKRGRVLVWTRHAHGIRGTLVGFLLAVDKHFNMVLSCLLHFTRKNSTRVWRLVHLHQFFVCHAHHLVLSFMIRSRKWGEDCWWWLHFYSLLSHPSLEVLMEVARTVALCCNALS